MFGPYNNKHIFIYRTTNLIINFLSLMCEKRNSHDRVKPSKMDI
jgi:hypothetical protein